MRHALKLFFIVLTLSGVASYPLRLYSGFNVAGKVADQLFVSFEL
jgi:hypothetical protein